MKQEMPFIVCKIGFIWNLFQIPSTNQRLNPHLLQVVSKGPSLQSILPFVEIEDEPRNLSQGNLPFNMDEEMWPFRDEILSQLFPSRRPIFAIEFLELETLGFEGNGLSEEEFRDHYQSFHEGPCGQVLGRDFSVQLRVYS